MSIASHVRHNEAGFTLIELIVAMALSLIVLFATLQSFDAFTSETSRQTRVTDANDQVRSIMDRTVRDLRGASVITVGAATNLVYSVPDSAGVRTERICVESSELYSFTQVTAVAPSTPTAACSSGARLAHLKSTTSTAFTYDGATSAATPATVRNVGLTFSLDATRVGKPGSSTLKASAAVRRTTAMLPIGEEDVDVVCSTAGPILNLGLGLGLAEDVGPLSVVFTGNGGVTVTGGRVDPVTGSAPVLLPSSVTAVTATITDALGVVRAIVPAKPVGCQP